MIMTIVRSHGGRVTMTTIAATSLVAIVDATKTTTAHDGMTDADAMMITIVAINREATAETSGMTIDVTAMMTATSVGTMQVDAIGLDAVVTKTVTETGITAIAREIAMTGEATRREVSTSRTST